MLAELEGNRLEVILVPCRREVNVGGCIRVAASKNAAWFRRYCAAYPSTRVRRNAAFDTKVKRAATVRLLSALIARQPTRSTYAAHLVQIAERTARRAA